MGSNENMEVVLVTSIEKVANSSIEQTIYDLDNQVQMLSSRACQLKCVSFLFPLVFKGCPVDCTD